MWLNGSCSKPKGIDQRLWLLLPEICTYKSLKEIGEPHLMARVLVKLKEVLGNFK